MSHSVEELWSEPIWHLSTSTGTASRAPVEERHRINYISCGNPIKLVSEKERYINGFTTVTSPEWEEKFSESHIIYKAMQAVPKICWIPNMNVTNFWDKLRWKLHLKLLTWKIII